MFDQLITENTLKDIIEAENKKGNYIVGKFFAEVKSIDDNIAKYKQSKGYRQKSLDDELDEMRNERDTLLEMKLKELVHDINSSSYQVQLVKKSYKSTQKAIYTINNDNVSAYFVIKHLQNCVKKLYKVKQANRQEVVNQFISIINGKLPIFVIRLDVKDFYESIPKKSVEYLVKENLLSPQNKVLLEKVYAKYQELSKCSDGLPRGVGISAFISEMYMRRFDDNINQMNDLVFYRRYVDDMIFVFMKSNKTAEEYVERIKDILCKYGLNLNEEKTWKHDFSGKSKEDNSMNFLGYKIIFGKDGKVTIDLSDKKKEKMKTRICAAIDDYKRDYSTRSKIKERLLFKRMRFLTGNSRLIGLKSGLLVGIYYSNLLITTTASLKELDSHLSESIEDLVCSDTYKRKIKEVSFLEGYNSKRIYYIKNSKELEIINRCWNKR